MNGQDDYTRESEDVKDPKMVPGCDHGGRRWGENGMRVAASAISVYSTGVFTPVLQRVPFPVWIAAAITRGRPFAGMGQGGVNRLPNALEAEKLPALGNQESKKF